MNQQPSRYELASEPIEVWLRQDNIKIDCWVVYDDESTDEDIGISSLSMRGAQREITGYLIAEGYEPVGRWSTEDQDGHETARQFRPAVPDTPLSASDFQELASVLTNEAMRGALDLLSTRPGEWLTYAEIAEYTGKSRAQLRGSLAALTRLVRKRFGKNSAPFEAPWRPDLNDYGFRMTAEQAAWWKHATAAD